MPLHHHFVCLGLTLSQAKAKIIELEDELRRLGKEAKTKVIEQMRKYKQVGPILPIVTNLIDTMRPECRLQ